MPLYALRYVLFGTRWGSNSSFAMVNLMFTSFCPARILLPCPDSNPLHCQLNYPKMYPRSAELTSPSAVPDMSESSVSNNKSLQHVSFTMGTTYSVLNTTAERLSPGAAVRATPMQCPSPHQSSNSQGVLVLERADALAVVDATEQQNRRDQERFHFPVLVPLWQIYVRERPLPIYLHTTFMSVAALLWPLQVCTFDFALLTRCQLYCAQVVCLAFDVAISHWTG